MLSLLETKDRQYIVLKIDTHATKYIDTHTYRNLIILKLHYLLALNKHELAWRVEQGNVTLPVDSARNPSVKRTSEDHSSHCKRY